MRILFICGSLEPGKDGVGDYVQHLAGELMRKGHDVQAVAVNDRLTDTLYDADHMLDAQALRVMRIPALWDAGRRYREAAEFKEQFRPDWISFQFVPYSFQDKGLPFDIKKLAALMGTQQNWHIMFHELWLGFSPGSTLKHKLIGFIQRNIMVSLARGIKPQLVTTSNRLYKRLLDENKVYCEILPLFSNISVAPVNQTLRADIYLKLGITTESRPDWHIMGVFGNIHPDSNLAQAMGEQLKSNEAAGKKTACIGIGNANAYGMEEFRRLEQQFAGRIQFIHLGSQTPDVISNVFQIIDIGISCTPADHIGKSGVFATMKLHGLRVVLPEQEIQGETDPDVVTYNQQLMEKPAHMWEVAYVADRFLMLLTDKTIKTLIQ